VVEQARGGGAYYVQVGPEGLRIGGGSFHMQPGQLARYRTVAAEDRRGGELAAILAKLAKQGWEVRGDRLKTAPRGFPADHPRIELLKHKSLYVGRGYEPDDGLHDRTTFDRVRRGWRQVRALNEWAADHIGLPE